MDQAGRQLFDTKGELIGVIAGAGYERKKFGTEWLLIETVSGRRTLVPADRITDSGERLVLPYPKGYVDTGPVLEGDAPLTPAGERLLRLHWGIGGAGPNSQCMTGCGLCMANQRFEHRRQSE
jgi:hypothetical protein